MSKKTLFIIIVILAFIGLVAVHSIQPSRENFEDLFEMDVPQGQHFEDKAVCLPNGRLGCTKEFWEVNSGCEMGKNDIVVYYYDNSCLVDGESNAWEHAIFALTKSYLYEPYKREDNLVILTNDLGSSSMPPFIVGTHNDDGSKVVFVGGYNLDDLMKYAKSIEFK